MRGATSRTITPVSRAYRWNEDGLAGICDRHQYLCFALALCNGCDPILKEWLFGLTCSEGNHGEDVKEYYFYLDNTPTHSYMKYLYKFPQAEYPYEQLLKENRQRTKLELEYELVDTGIFDQGRYFDVVVEYAKAEPQDLLIRICITNRGPEAAPIDVLPMLWFRNTWSWGRDDRRPSISAAVSPSQQTPSLVAKHWELGEYTMYCSGADALLFTESETNNERLYGVPSPTPYVKDAFNAYVVNGKREAVNPAATGTKAAARNSRLAQRRKGGKGKQFRTWRSWRLGASKSPFSRFAVDRKNLRKPRKPSSIVVQRSQTNFLRGRHILEFVERVKQRIKEKDEC